MEASLVKLDPRTKMVMVICLTSLAVIYNTPVTLLLTLAVTVILLILFGFRTGTVWGGIKPFIFLLLVLFIIQVIFSPGGKTYLSFGHILLLSSHGLNSGGCVVLRILIVVAASLALTTINSRDFILALVQWKIPYEIAFMVSIALRFLPIFRDEMVNVVTAVQLRGVELKKVPWGNKLAMYQRLLFPVAYGAILKAQQLAIAMEARGFRAYPKRTYLRRLYFNPRDYAVMGAFLVSTLILVALNLLTGILPAYIIKVL